MTDTEERAIEAKTLRAAAAIVNAESGAIVKLALKRWSKRGRASTPKPSGAR